MIESIDFHKLTQLSIPVIPVVTQDIHTKDVLILSYVNDEALRHTIQSGYATFWSTSRNCLWEKGATSGDRFKIVEIRINCEENSLLYLVSPEGSGACHTTNSSGQHRQTCFYRQIVPSLFNLDP